MKIRSFLFITALMLIASCTSEMAEMPQTSENEHSSTRVSIEDALSRAEETLGLIEGETRSTVRKVGSVVALGEGSATRGAGLSDTLLYLVNYESGNGFALLGADSRMLDIYAISDEGSLTYEDLTTQPGLKEFYHNALLHANQSTMKAPESGILYPIGGGWTGTTKINIVHEVKPLINPNVAKWGQNSPYNRYCFTSEGKQSYPGCFPVAIGIYMSYYRWPESYSGTTYNIIGRA